MNRSIRIADKKAKSQNSVPRTQKAEHSQSRNSHVEHVLFLQRTLGNQAVQRLMKSGAMQAKLRLGMPGNIYEQEADGVAEQVMRMPDTGRSKNIAISEQIHGTSIQRRCPKCPLHRADEDDVIQTKEAADTTHEAAPALETGINAVGGRGQPLPGSVRSFFEQRFGHDFSQVRVHTDAKAAESARAINAYAYTVAQDIYFGAGRYAPSSGEGQRLLAHELTHTVQNAGTGNLHPFHKVGQPNDPAEHEADRVADAVVAGDNVPPMVLGRTPALLRRMPEEPKPLRTDTARLPAPGHGTEAHIHVIRKLIPCECRWVPDVREGVFWNPDMDAFAIAYKHCRGGTIVDVYGQVESSLSSYLTGGPPPTGTATIGFEINVVGRKVGGRVVLEVLGSNVSGGEGVGGRAQVVFQGGRWRIFVTSDFLHRLSSSPGNVLDFNMGARLGPITVEAKISDALSPTPRGTGAFCIDLGGSMRPCGTLSAGGGTGITVGGEIRGTFGGPEVIPEKCFQCLCPPPTKSFKCFLDIPPTERPVTREIEVQVPNEHRYYFSLDRTTPSEESELKARSVESLDAVAREVASGGHIVSITGYASPEATEAHNMKLSDDRAKTLLGLLRSRLPAGTILPLPSAGGELLGRRPVSSPTSRLGDVARTAGFRSAEEVSIFLFGDEVVLSRELSDQFVSLFRAMPDAADRLALFGLEPSDPLAPWVLRTIEEFLHRPYAGSRPWEHVFRLLRFGVISTSRPGRQSITELERRPGSLDELYGEECRARGLEAERSGLLPPVPLELQHPRRGREDRDVECTIEVQPNDSRYGCSYKIPPDMRLSPSAPTRAPRWFPE